MTKEIIKGEKGHGMKGGIREERRAKAGDQTCISNSIHLIMEGKIYALCAWSA